MQRLREAALKVSPLQEAEVIQKVDPDVDGHEQGIFLQLRFLNLATCPNYGDFRSYVGPVVGRELLVSPSPA